MSPPIHPVPRPAWRRAPIPTAPHGPLEFMVHAGWPRSASTPRSGCGIGTGSELFALRLPAERAPPNPLSDFDFRCTPNGCWLAVPLTRGKLALYDLGPYAE